MRQLFFSVTLKDCDVKAKRGSGAGGQNRNKRDTAIRIVHRDSGAVGESEEERSQLQNKRTAFKRMTETPVFKTWLRRESALRSGMPTPEQQVEKQWKPELIRTEIKEKGKWQEIPTMLHPE
jgi:protein subunit release factor B